MAENFVHLNVHTEYSLLNNYNPMEKLINKAIELKFKAMAITDYNNMYGVIDFYKRCKKANIKPIIGSEITIKYKNNKFYNVILLAKNNKGYKNLCKLVSNLYVVEDRDKTFITFDELLKFSNNLILIFGSRRSFLYDCVTNNNLEMAKAEILNFKNIFNKEDLFLELNFHFESNDEKNINTYLKLSSENNINTVVTNDVHYVDGSCFNLFNIARCIDKGIEISELKDEYFTKAEYYLKSEEEMLKIFSQLKQSINNTKYIADRCNVDFDFKTYHLPEYTVPDGFTTKEDFLYSLVQNGVKKRYPKLTDEIRKRIKYELTIINKMGFTDYFLIVWDFINFAIENKIAFGPGRGSGASSIVAYCLYITDIDPIKYDLIFERFLNPERISMPDFDIDFCNERREEVINYVINKYGKDRVSQIVTFGTIKPRVGIRDIARVLGYKLALVDKIAKLIPINSINFKQALDSSKELKSLYDNDIEIKKMINIAEKFENIKRHISIHAAGIVITKEPLTNYVPLCRSSSNILTQYNMIELEELGLLKIDFLGLRTLTVIDDTINLIKKDYGKLIDIKNIDLNDKNVLKLFKTAETIGVFQFESVGMRLFLKDLDAKDFDELILANSIFRPGPMNQIPNYIKNKNNPKNINYLDSRIEKYLKNTYGIIVYQEQVMQIARELAGYSWGQADNLRKAIGKKNMSIMEHNRKIFIYGLDDISGNIKIKGCIRNGVNEDLAKKIFNLIIEFGNYAFNKSHSACYTLNAFRTAYLKCYYPLEFMCSLLNSVVNFENQFFKYFQEAKRIKIKFLLPDINKSFYKLIIDKKNIRLGFSNIKSLNKILCTEIIQERKKGEFKSFIDFLNRCKNLKNLNLLSVENFIKAGAFDSISKSRNELLSSYQELFKQIVSKSKFEISGQLSLINSENVEKKDFNLKKFTKNEILEFEKDVLGFYLSSHPLEAYKNYIKKENAISLSKLKTLKKGIYEIIVYVNSIKIRKNKKNKLVKTINVEDFSTSMDLLDIKNLEIKKSQVVKLFVNITENYYGSTHFSISNFTDIDNIFSKKLYVKVKELNFEIKEKILEISKKYNGYNSIYIYIESDNKTIELDISIDLRNKELIEYLYKNFKKNNIKIV